MLSPPTVASIVYFAAELTITNWTKEAQRLNGCRLQVSPKVWHGYSHMTLNQAFRSKSLTTVAFKFNPPRPEILL